MTELFHRVMTLNLLLSVTAALTGRVIAHLPSTQTHF